VLLLLAIGWFGWQYASQDREGLGSTASGAATGAANTPSVPATDTNAPPTGTVPGGLVTDVGAYAATTDRLSLVGREAVLADSRVVRVVGPKSFTLASGSEELLVLIDQDHSREDAAQDRIESGNTIGLKGSFQRVGSDEMASIDSDRFRNLTEPEREWLRKTKVYLHAREYSNAK
jgi:hypothetical protein